MPQPSVESQKREKNTPLSFYARFLLEEWEFLLEVRHELLSLHPIGITTRFTKGTPYPLPLIRKIKTVMSRFPTQGTLTNPIFLHGESLACDDNIPRPLAG